MYHKRESMNYIDNFLVFEGHLFNRGTESREHIMTNEMLISKSNMLERKYRVNESK